MDINYITSDIFNPDRKSGIVACLKKPECRMLILPNGIADYNSSYAHFYRCYLTESIKICDFLDE